MFRSRKCHRSIIYMVVATLFFPRKAQVHTIHISTTEEPQQRGLSRCFQLRCESLSARPSYECPTVSSSPAALVLVSIVVVLASSTCSTTRLVYAECAQILEPWDRRKRLAVIAPPLIVMHSNVDMAL